MATKIIVSAIVILGSLAGMTVVSPVVSNLSAASTGTSGVPVAHAAGTDESVAPAQMGMDAVGRAHDLAAGPVTLTPGRLFPHDFNYAGFVGYVWKLPPELEKNYAGWSQELRTNHAVEIPYPMLEPGDVLATVRGGQFGQAVVFEKWADPKFWHNMVSATDQQSVDEELTNGVQFDAFVMTGTNGNKAVMEKHMTLKSVKGAISIKEMEQEAAGPYFALRNNEMKGFVRMWDTPIVLNPVKGGVSAYVKYSIVNKGGSPVQVSEMGAVAYGPNAESQGLASAQSNFQAAPNFTLQPGEIHTYSQTLKLDQMGQYLVLPKFAVNGVMQVPLENINFQVLGQ